MSEDSLHITQSKENIPKDGGGQIVLYQPDESVSLEVKLDVDADTVWLTQAQMCDLFQKVKSTISYHISNIFAEDELDAKVAVRKFRTTTKHGAIKNKTQVDEVNLYNLDVVISVGYRVKSKQGTKFRQWATKVLREHLLRGYSVSQQLLFMQKQIDQRLNAQNERILRVEDKQDQQQRQLDFFIRTNTPPAEMVFYNGEFFTARVAIESLIKTAKRRVIIIDHYIDAKTFDMFDVRSEGVQGIIYTQGVGAGMTRLKQEHDSQPNVQPVEVRKWRLEPHDRWLIIDDQLYHCGHSLNATGRKLSAITQMGTPPEDILSQME